MAKKPTGRRRRFKPVKHVPPYVKRTFLDGEEVLYCARMHWIYTLKCALPLIGVITLFGLVFLLSGEPGVLLLGTVLAVPALIFFLVRMTKKWTNLVVVTNKRLIYQRGWTARATTDLGIDRILGHKMDEDAWGQFLGYGKFVVVGAGLGDIPLPEFLSNPIGFRRALTGKKEELYDEEDEAA
jgi:hypothetical protein